MTKGSIKEKGKEQEEISRVAGIIRKKEQEYEDGIKQTILFLSFINNS